MWPDGQWIALESRSSSQQGPAALWRIAAPIASRLTSGWNYVCRPGTTKPPKGPTSAITGQFAILYMLRNNQDWRHYVPGGPEVSNIAEVEQYDAVLMLVTREDRTTCAFAP